jgi:hypothetical protein
MPIWGPLGEGEAKFLPVGSSQSGAAQPRASAQTASPGTGSEPVPPNTLPDNAGLAADAAREDQARLRARQDVLQEVDHNVEQATLSLHASLQAGDKEIQDLTGENENDLDSLNPDQGNFSGVLVTVTLNRVSARLKQIQTIRNEQWALQDKYAHEAKGWAEQYANATPISLKAVQYDPNPHAASGRAAYVNYINQALDLMGVNDPTARANWMKGLLTAAPRESSYQPWEVNTWDSNAVGKIMPDNAPQGSSRGALQVTPTNFADYHLSGTSNNIYDPVANITASMNYLMDTQGVLPDGSNLSSVQQFNPNAPPMGY